MNRGTNRYIKIKNNILGIVVYEMSLDGCLTGFWTDNKLQGELLNEIAKKKSGLPNQLEGEYKSAYIDIGNVVVEGELVVEKTKDNLYTLKWINIKNNKIEYIGYGYKFGNQFIASYWEN